MCNKQNFKFDKNLLDLSISDNLIDAKTEWSLICEQIRPDKNGLCLCNHSIKNVMYLYNIKTNKTISIGPICAEKFELKINDELDDAIKQTLKKKILQTPIYKKPIIDDVNLYSDDIQAELIKHFESLVSASIASGFISHKGAIYGSTLINIKDKINNLKQKYNITCLNNMLMSIDDKLDQLIKPDAIQIKKNDDEENVKYIDIRTNKKLWAEHVKKRLEISKRTVLTIYH